MRLHEYNEFKYKVDKPVIAVDSRYVGKTDELYWHRFKETHFASERINLNPGTLGTTSAPVKKVRSNTQTLEAYPQGMYETGRVKNDEIHALCKKLWSAPGYELMVTYGISQTMNLLCLSMLRRFYQEGKPTFRVITTMHEHKGGIGPFNHLPEYEVHYVTDEVAADPELLKRKVEEFQPHVAFISHVYYDTGNIAPLDNWCNTIRKTTPECKIIIDAAQSFGMYDPPFGEADVIVTSTHKWLFGPHGGGLTWMKKDFQDWIEGIYWNGNAVTNRPNAERMGIQGGQDFMLYTAIAEALIFYKQTGKEIIFERSCRLAKAFSNELEKIFLKKGISYTLLNKEHNSPMISLAFTDYDPYPLYASLNERGIHIKCIMNHETGDKKYDILRFGIPYYETKETLNEALSVIDEQLNGPTTQSKLQLSFTKN